MAGPRTSGGEHSFQDSFHDDEDPKSLSNRKRVRKLLEEHLERKRLKEELDDELSGEFDRDEFDRGP